LLYYDKYGWEVDVNIQGLQKLTLLDYPGKVACTVFTPGCNLRCPFCHNSALVTHVDSGNGISNKDVLDFLSRRRGVLDGLCITGGEPLLQPGIKAFIREVKKLGYLVKLDTNGTKAECLQDLVKQKLIDYVAMDIKNTPEKYKETAGAEEHFLDDILQSANFLLSGVVPYEFRTTVVKELHELEDFTSIGRWIKGAERYYLQAFVDSGDLIQSGLQGFETEQMEQALEIVREFIPNAELRGIR
jgi:pyruvate formate lyase activating enzyme